MSVCIVLRLLRNLTILILAAVALFVLMPGGAQPLPAPPAGTMPGRARAGFTVDQGGA